jgi:RNA-binding protein YlmH
MAEGIFTDSERRMVVFCNETVEGFPIKLIKITNKSKFTKLEHRDYLGAMMSLGVKREKIGDFVIQGNSCYVAICEDIYEYIINNLTAIGKCPCEIVEELDFCGLPSIEYKDETIIATSQRLDCIVSSLTNLSRSKAILLINGGKVLLNYEEIVEKDKVVQLGSTITIRGFGKYRIVDIAGNSNSGRLKINVKKYI